VRGSYGGGLCSETVLRVGELPGRFGSTGHSDRDCLHPNTRKGGSPLDKGSRLVCVSYRVVRVNWSSREVANQLNSKER